MTSSTPDPWLVFSVPNTASNLSCEVSGATNDAAPSSASRRELKAYKMWHLLSVGKQSIVYRAIDQETDRLVIIKYLRRDYPRFVELVEFPNHHVMTQNLPIPQMDSFSTIEHIRQSSTWQDLPIIALTALVIKGDRDRCLAVGANEYFSKPVKLKILPCRIQALPTDSLS